MRLFFAVHTYLNLTLCDSEGNLIIGNPVEERNLATRQTHLLTIDKPVISLRIFDAFRPQEEQSSKDF